jgi:hypothetical protein
MAVTRQENTIRIVDDDSTLVGTYYIEGILYLPGTSASIKETNTGGEVLWSTGANATTRIFDDVCIRLKGTTHFDLAGAGAELILYLRVE